MNDYRMKTLALCCFAITGLYAGGALTSPVYEPEMGLTNPITPAQSAAMHFLIRNTDEAVFLTAFNGSLKSDKNDDEFTSTGSNQSNIETNRSALAYARRVYNGEVDFLLVTSLHLRRYNPANQTFLTDLTTRKLTLGVNLYPALNNVPGFTAMRRDMLPAGSWKIAYLDTVVIEGADMFSGIKLSPGNAKLLSEDMGKARNLQLVLNCRFIPGTLTKDGKVSATVRSYRLLNANPDRPLRSDTVRTMRADYYVRTAAEKEFESKYLNRLMYSPAGMFIFGANGELLSGIQNLDSPRYSGRQRGAAIIDTVTAMKEHATEWYLMGDKLFLIKRDYENSDGNMAEQLVPFNIDHDGTLRINGVAYREETRVSYSGNGVKWNP